MVGGVWEGDLGTSEFTLTVYKTYGPKLCKMSVSEMLVEINKISARNSLILQH